MSGSHCSGSVYQALHHLLSHLFQFQILPWGPGSWAQFMLVSHRNCSSLNASRQECHFVVSGREHGSPRSCLPNFSESPQQCSPQLSTGSRVLTETLGQAPAQALAQLGVCPVDAEACKLSLAVAGTCSPGYLGIFYCREVHLYLIGCVLQRQRNHRFESWGLILTKILLLWLGTLGLSLLDLK